MKSLPGKETFSQILVPVQEMLVIIMIYMSVPVSVDTKHAWETWAREVVCVSGPLGGGLGMWGRVDGDCIGLGCLGNGIGDTPQCLTYSALSSGFACGFNHQDATS